MSAPPFYSDEPTETSVSLLASNFRNHRETKGLSPENCAHRLRVIRQQRALLARKMAGDADERSKQPAMRSPGASGSADHRDEGGEA